jgi:hypothetical protein
VEWTAAPHGNTPSDDIVSIRHAEAYVSSEPLGLPHRFLFFLNRTTRDWYSAGQKVLAARARRQDGGATITALPVWCTNVVGSDLGHFAAVV